MNAKRNEQQLTRPRLVLEAMLHVRSVLRVVAFVRADGGIASAQAVERLPDGVELIHAVMCYRSERAKALPTLRRMAREHKRASADPRTCLGMIDGAFWFREFAKAADPRNVFRRPMILRANHAQV